MAIVDKKTPRLGLLLPNADNFLQDDVERLIQSFDLLDVLVVMRDQTTGKIADDQLSAVIARLDAQGKIATSALPSSVVQKGADGKIDASVLPSIAIIDSFPVPNEASMLGLQCERGDIAIRTDLGRSFILTDLPPSRLSNWRELTSTNVTSVNGQVGAITGLAKSGANDDITSLNALSGPLRLGGDASGDYDAVTLKQLRAASGGAGGASMNGVMNNFIGAVEWFNGSRAKMPAGYIAADGQECSQTDPATADLYAAVAADMFVTVTEDLWQNSGIADTLRKGENRGAYVKQSSTGKFRVPDLNGAYADGSTPGANFLRGDGGGKFTSEIGGVGAVKYNAAPDIQGTFYTMTNNYDAAYADGAFREVAQDGGVTNSTLSGPDRSDKIGFKASNWNSTYGRGTEVRPNSVTGIWIIRASGTFTAQNTNFNVITGDSGVPAAGVSVKGGEVISSYQVAGADYVQAALRSKLTIGGQAGAEIVLRDRRTGTLVESKLDVSPTVIMDFNDAVAQGWITKSSGLTVSAGTAQFVIEGNKIIVRGNLSASGAFWTNGANIYAIAKLPSGYSNVNKTQCPCIGLSGVYTWNVTRETSGVGVMVKLSSSSSGSQVTNLVVEDVWYLS